MDEGRDRGRALHRVGQPGEERQLGRLADRAHEEEERDGQVGVGGDARVGLGEDLAVVQGAEGDPDQHDAEAEAEVPHPGHDEGLLARVGGRLPLVPEADQEVGAEAHRLPEHVQDQEVAGQHQHHHREHEEVQVGEEAGVAVVVVHVAGGVEVDEEAHSGHHQQHHRGELVHLRGDRGLERSRDHPREQVAGPGLAVPDPDEHEARGHERGEEGRNRDPVRLVPDEAPEQGVDQRAEQREQRDQPDES